MSSLLNTALAAVTTDGKDSFLYYQNGQDILEAHSASGSSWTAKASTVTSNAASGGSALTAYYVEHDADFQNKSTVCISLTARGNQEPCRQLMSEHRSMLYILTAALKLPTESRSFLRGPGKMGRLMEFRQTLRQPPGLPVELSMAPAGIQMDPNGSTTTRQTSHLQHFLECY